MHGFSTFSKIRLGLNIAAFLFVIVGFATPYWCDEGRFNYGLFETCISGDCRSITEESLTNGLRTVVAMEVVGLLMAMACFILVVSEFCVEMTQRRVVNVVAAVLTFATGFFIIVGAFIFAKDNREKGLILRLGWSLAIEVLAGILYLVIDVVFVIDIIMN